jgi:hypothetical protein
MTDAELDAARALADHLYAEANAIEQAYKAARHLWYEQLQRVEAELFERRVRAEVQRIAATIGAP